MMYQYTCARTYSGPVLYMYVPRLNPTHRRAQSRARRQWAKLKLEQRRVLLRRRL